MADYDLDAFDMGTLNEAKEMTGKRFVQMIEYYLEDGQMYLDAIKDGLEAGDKDKVAQAAHPFKSSSRSLGAGAVGEIAEHMELIAKEALENGADIEALKPLVPQLEEAFIKASEKLKEFLGE